VIVKLDDTSAWVGLVVMKSGNACPVAAKISDDRTRVCICWDMSSWDAWTLLVFSQDFAYDVRA